MVTGRIALLAVLMSALPVGISSHQTTSLVWTKPDQFWFRKSVPGGHIWVSVDAQHGVKEPLFDHQRLAIELSLRTGAAYTPLTLPFADPEAQLVVKYDGSNAYIQEGAMAIEFNLDGQFWRCDLQIKWDWNRVPPTDYECASRRGATPGLASADGPSSPVVSPNGRWQAFVLNHNIAVRPVGTDVGPTVLTTDGEAADAYLSGSIRWSDDSRTLTAYRVHADVWIADSVVGNVKRLIAKGQWVVKT